MHYIDGKLLARVDGVDVELGGGVPVGTIIAWPSSSAPTEGGTWLLCNGQSCSSYPALVAIVGSTVPNLNGRFLEGTIISPRTFLEPSLPNIWGTFGNCEERSHTNRGAFYLLGTSGGSVPDDMGGINYDFNASRCSSIYGASDTVQPAAYLVMYYIKAA